MATKKNYVDVDIDKLRKHPNYTVFIVVLAVLAIGVWLTSVSLYQQKKQREEIPVVAVTSVPELDSQSTVSTQGIMALQQKNDRVATGQSVEVTVSLDSDKKDVVGYDVLLKYDPDAVDFVNTSSLIPSFSAVPVARDGLVSVTGYKALGANDPTVFSNTPVLRFVFTAKQKGTHTFSVLPSSGKQKTRIIDVDLNRLSPRTTSLQVEIY